MSGHNGRSASGDSKVVRLQPRSVTPQSQWCVVRGCVALADAPNLPYCCRIHASMSREERDDWSREHSFTLPEMRSLMSRIEFRRADGTEYGYDDHGRRYEGTITGRHWYPGRRDVATNGATTHE